MGQANTSFQLVVDGQVQLDIAFRGFNKSLGNWTDTWENVAKGFYTMEKRHFRTYQFAPLSDRYAAWKKINFPGKPVMRRTDALFNALTSYTTGSVKIITPREMTVGSHLGYEMFHHSTKPRKRLPRRPLVDIQPQERRQFRSIVQRDVVARAKSYGFRVTGEVRQGAL